MNLTPPFAGAVAIYGLCDPRTGETRYIGKSVNPAQRYSQHRNSPRTPTESHVARWIATLQAGALQPLLRIIDWVSVEHWERAEQHYIALARASGARLTNQTDGGRGARPVRGRPQSVRRRIPPAPRKRERNGPKFGHEMLISFSEPQVEWMRTRAEELGLSVSEFVRRIIDAERLHERARDDGWQRVRATAQTTD